MEPVFFASPAAFRRWLEKHHATSPELLVGFYKKHTGKPSLTWQESVDEALCFGWIDGIRRSIDHEGYAIRFTPRRKGSTWSAINLERVPELVRAGRMTPAGLAAYRVRDPAKSGLYSFEQRHQSRLTPAMQKEFRANRKAWAFWEAQPPGYRRIALFYVMSARREETRQRRLERLIADSAAGRRIGLLQRPATPRSSEAPRKSGKGRGPDSGRTGR